MQYESAKLSAEALLEEYSQTRNPHIREALAEMHLYIAGIIARRFSGRGVDYDDLYQVASLALLKAIERFDVHKGVKFVSFATPTMVGEVKNYFRDKSRLISFPRRSTHMNRRLDQAREALEQQLGRSPTATELAGELDVALDTVLEALEMRGAMSPASLDGVGDDPDESPLSQFLGTEEQGFSTIEQRSQIEWVLGRLKENERQVLILRYFKNLSQRSVAERMGVSQMTISRIERRALQNVRQLMAEEEREE